MLDVGPWNTHDDEYVFGTARPAAELGKSLSNTGNTNRAGIDLGEAVWRALEMKDNGDIDWKFYNGDATYTITPLDTANTTS